MIFSEARAREKSVLTPPAESWFLAGKPAAGMTRI